MVAKQKKIIQINENSSSKLEKDTSEDRKNESSDQESSSIKYNTISQTLNSNSEDFAELNTTQIDKKEYKSEKKPNKKKNSKKNKKDKKITEQVLKIKSEDEFKSCLKMNKIYFNCDNEINLKFGNKIFKLNQECIPKKCLAKNRYLNMRHYLIKGDPQWPHLNRDECGIRMNFIEQKNEFVISFDIDYLKKKEIFDFLINSMLLEDIHIFMEKNPFFFQGLIKLAEINMMRSEPEEVFKYLQKALYVFESSLHPLFSPFFFSNGRPRTALNSDEIESREVFILIGYYMNYLGFRGLFRTALEYCILLLSMDISRDHFHSLLHVDYYSIQSSSFDTLIEINDLFLIQFSEYCTWNTRDIDDNTLGNQLQYNECLNDITLYHILPNFSFGIPLALYLKYLESEFADQIQQTNKMLEQIKLININQILTTKFSSQNIQNCSIYLIQSLLVFPEFILLLLKKIKIENSYPMYNEYLVSWKEIHSFFFNLTNSLKPEISRNEKAQYPYLLVGKLLIEAYIEKCGDIWKSQINLEWIHICCSHLYKIVNKKPNLDILVNNFVAKRRNALMESRFNVFRYLDVSISEFSRENLILPLFFRSEDSFQNNLNLRNDLLPFSSLSLNSDPILLFFQTLLPWSTINEYNGNSASINLKELITNCFNSFKNYLFNNIKFR